MCYATKAEDCIQLSRGRFLCWRKRRFHWRWALKLLARESFQRKHKRPFKMVESKWSKVYKCGQFYRDICTSEWISLLLVCHRNISQFDSESVEQIIFINKGLHRRYTEDMASTESTEVPEQLPTIKQEPAHETQAYVEQASHSHLCFLAPFHGAHLGPGWTWYGLSPLVGIRLMTVSRHLKGGLGCRGHTTYTWIYVE